MRGFDLEASYIRVEGFEITADKPATAVQLRAGHCEILDNYIHDMMTAVSGTVGKPSADGSTRDYSAVTHNRIAFNKVYHCQYGFVLGGEQWLVENNEVNRLFMYASGNGYDDCDYSRFFGRGCVERGNYFHGSTASEIRVAHVDGLQTFTVNGEIARELAASALIPVNVVFKPVVTSPDAILEVCRDPGFTPAKLRAALAAAGEIH